ncbi:hypothetical protein D3C71_1426340 [compost metagenome]
MLLDDLARADLGRFLERNRLLEPRSGDHPGTVLILISLRSLNRIPDTVDEPDIHFQTLCHLDLHRVVRNKFGFRGHDRLAGCALRQLIHCADAVRLARNVGQDDRFHKAFDKR